MLKRTGLLACAAALGLAACGPTTPEERAYRQHEAGCIAGSVTGALLGAAVGNAFGGGTGRTIMTAAGGAAGATAGNALTCG